MILGRRLLEAFIVYYGSLYYGIPIDKRPPAVAVLPRLSLITSSLNLVMMGYVSTPVSFYLIPPEVYNYRC